MTEADFNAQAKHRGWFCRTRLQTDGTSEDNDGHVVNLLEADYTALHMTWGDGTTATVLLPNELLEDNAALLDWGELTKIAELIRWAT